ncbi:MAG: hypothetical protein M1131_04035 [Actinobacteria bacterium]|nr:hypothetical protein [Actinomycetota bacterium]MCL6096023.1 hypothetical protein [Actinomycetota bacterium]
MTTEKRTFALSSTVGREYVLDRLLGSIGEAAGCVDEFSRNWYHLSTIARYTGLPTEVSRSYLAMKPADILRVAEG